MVEIMVVRRQKIPESALERHHVSRETSRSNYTSEELRKQGDISK